MTQSNTLFSYTLMVALGALIDPLGYDTATDQELIDRNDPEDAMCYIDSNIVAAGLEESQYQPIHGKDGVLEYIDWFLDGGCTAVDWT